MKKEDMNETNFKFHLKGGFININFKPEILSLNLLLEIVNKAIFQTNEKEIKKIKKEIDELIKKHSQSYEVKRMLYGSDLKRIDAIKPTLSEILNNKTNENATLSKEVFEVKSELNVLREQTNYLEEAITVNITNTSVTKQLNNYIVKMKNKIKSIENNLSIGNA